MRSTYRSCLSSETAGIIALVSIIVNVRRNSTLLVDDPKSEEYVGQWLRCYQEFLECNHLFFFFFFGPRIVSLVCLVSLFKSISSSLHLKRMELPLISSINWLLASPFPEARVTLGFLPPGGEICQAQAICHHS